MHNLGPFHLIYLSASRKVNSLLVSQGDSLSHHPHFRRDSKSLASASVTLPSSIFVLTIWSNISTSVLLSVARYRQAGGLTLCRYSRSRRNRPYAFAAISLSAHPSMNIFFIFSSAAIDRSLAV